MLRLSTLNPRIYLLAAAANGVVRRTNQCDALHEVASVAITVRVRNDTPVAVTLNGLLDVANRSAEVLHTEEPASLCGSKTTTAVEIIENTILLSNSCHNETFQTGIHLKNKQTLPLSLFVFGNASSRGRTCDLSVKSRMLCQLSYRGVKRFCKEP